MTVRALALRRHFPIRLRSWRFERQPFVVTLRLDYDDDVSRVSPSSSLSDYITKTIVRALALRRHFPIRLRSWRFRALALRRHFPIRLQSWRFRALALRRHFPIRLRSWRFTRCPSSPLSDQITKLTSRALALRRQFPIRLRRWRFEREPFVVTLWLDYEDDVSSVGPSSFALSLDGGNLTFYELVWYQI